MSCTTRNRVCAVAALAAAASAAAQSPLGTTFTYQASLLDSDEPASGAFDLVFTLYDATVGGTAVGGPLAANDWPVDAGLFSIALDFGAGAFNGDARWLEIAVRPGASGGGYTTLAPRQPILATPYALYALNGGAGGELWQESPNGGIYYDAGNVGIGTDMPSTRLTVVGTGNAVQVQTSGGGSAIVGTHSEGGNGVMGQSLGNGVGVYGLSNTGAAMMGQNTTSGALGGLGYQQYAVYGLKADGIAGYFDGDVRITGDLTVDGAFDPQAWRLTGNAGTVPGVDFLGTIDNQPLELRVNNARALRIEPGVGPVGEAVNNIVAGYHGNQVAGGSIGATIAGGGYDGNFGAHNQVLGNFGAVGGGYKNTAAHSATIAGGAENSAAQLAAVGGGRGNAADGAWSAIAGGLENVAGGNWAAIVGGRDNTTAADYAAVGGGWANLAGGSFAAVPGGFENQAGGSYSFAAGRRAKVRDATEVGGGDTDGDEGTFVWADSTDADFTSTGPNQFLVRAAGGVEFVVDADPNTGGGLRVLPVAAPDSYGNSTPNLVNGCTGNSVTSGVVGATISGGGAKIVFTSAAQNVVTDDYGTVGGGARNQAGDGLGLVDDARFATVGGGYRNYATRDSSTVGGGRLNDATGSYSTVGGGIQNEATGHSSTLSGGNDNHATGGRSTVGGGSGNEATGDDSTIPGGAYNQAGGSYSFAAGRRAKVRDPNEVGDPNDLDGDQGTFVWADASDPYNYFASTGPNQFLVRATGGIDLNVDASGGGLRVEPTPTSPNVIGGHAANIVYPGAEGAIIAGGGRAGFANTVQSDADIATVSGGMGNHANSEGCAIAGGLNNTAAGMYSTIAGGSSNETTGGGAAIGGGLDSEAGYLATVGGGYGNRAEHYGSVGGGSYNSAWSHATIPGGRENQAGGYYSFAAGRRAKVRDPNQVGGGDLDGDEGTFVWADSTDADFISTGPDQFLVRAHGGVQLVVDNTTPGFASQSGLRVIPATPYWGGWAAPNIVGGFSGNDVAAGVWGATIAGGGEATTDTLFWYLHPNLVSAECGTIAGGAANSVSGRWGTIAGGFGNAAVGDYAVVPGGRANRAGGVCSFAAGRYAKVRDPNSTGDADGDEGAFVWSDTSSSDPNSFISTGPNQFLIRATGGVGINTNTPDPNSLTVNGVVRSLTGGFRFPDGVTISSGAAVGDITGVTAGSGLTGGGASGSVTLSASFAGNGSAATISRSDHYHNALNASDGSPTNAVFVDAAGYVGIGNTTPGYPLHFASTTGEKICFYGPTTGNNTGIGLSTTLLMLHGQGSAGAAAFGYGSAAAFTEGARITWDGKIGAGTDAPAVRLHASNGTDATLAGGGFLQLGDSSGYNVVLDNDELMARNNSAVTTLHLNRDGGDIIVGGSTAGNVGIGAVPSAKLHVAGTPGVDGIKFPDSTLQTTASRGITAASVSVDPPSLSSGSATSIAVTVTGAVSGDAVVANPGANLPDGYGITFVRVSGANTVTIGFVNGSASSQNPASSSWQFRLIK